MQISGSSAVVVGGAGGLGEATVRRLHTAGAKVVVADLVDAKGKNLESELGVRYVAARDLSPLGIRVVTIALGMFLTPAYPVPAEQLEAHRGPQILFPKRLGQPAEYAAMVASIVENDYLNGEVIRLDGALRFPPK